MKTIQMADLEVRVLTPREEEKVDRIILGEIKSRKKFMNSIRINNDFKNNNAAVVELIRKGLRK